MIKFKRKIYLFKRKRGNYRRKEVFNYIKNGLRNATTHGLSYLVNDRIYLFERIFWLFSFIVSIALIFLLLIAQYQRFIEAPTVVSVDMDYFDWNISFPAITLCPLYKVNIPTYKDVIRKNNSPSDLASEGYLWAIIHTNIQSLEYVKMDVADEVVTVYKPEEYAELSAAVFRSFEFNTIEAMVTKINHPVTITSAMTEMGMCHVLNSNIAVYDQPSVWKSGSPKYVKNNIELSIYDRDFFLEITNYAKVYKVYIHGPDEVITGTTSSFTFDVEGFMSFGLSVWTTRISDELRDMPLRIRKCRFIDEPISERYPIYSYSHCLLECRIMLVNRLCGCVPHFYKTLPHERICHIRELKCVLHYLKDIVTLAPAEAPLELRNTQGLPTSSRDCGCLSTCELDQYHKDREDYMSQDSYVLEIRITSFPKVRVIRDIIFNFYDIFLKTGGVINLCLGCSIISLIECLVIFLKICIYVLK
ncbi:unnamed protein product [Colias eurytheme]|nr:unnamed protein product [Colias eurytheme]